jgi:outer membrane protein assembly factor BamB
VTQTASNTNNLHVTEHGQILLEMNDSIGSWSIDGRRLWHISKPVFPSLRNLVSDRQGRLFVSYNSRYDSMLYSLDSEGNLRWKHLYLKYLSNVALDAEGNLRVIKATASQDRHEALCLNADGKELWRSSPLPPSAFSNGWGVLALTPQGRAFATNGDVLVCIDPKGKTLWQYKIPAARSNARYQSGLQFAVSADGYAYLSRTTEGILEALSPDGKRLGAIALPDEITGIALGDRTLCLTVHSGRSRDAGYVLVYELLPASE